LIECFKLVNWKSELITNRFFPEFYCVTFFSTFLSSINICLLVSPLLFVFDISTLCSVFITCICLFVFKLECESILIICRYAFPRTSGLDSGKNFYTEKTDKTEIEVFLFFFWKFRIFRKFSKRVSRPLPINKHTRFDRVCLNR